MHQYENRINTLLAQMTITEKVGQLQQSGVSIVGTFGVSFMELLNMRFDGRITEEEFIEKMSSATRDFHEDDLRAGKIGSYMGTRGSEETLRLQHIAVEESRLGIPLLFGDDVIHGFRTVTPIPLAESCAWDEDLWQRTARMAAAEATSCGIHMTFAPMVDVAKDARWGRISEGAGEDTLLNSLYGAAKVRGFQGEDLSQPESMAACVKHFAAYGAAEGGRDYNRVDMSMQRLFEEYMPPYEACVKAGARAIMPAYNELNGVPCSVNTWLLRDVLRRRWGFEGMTLSDCNAMAEAITHGAIQDRREAAVRSMEAGMDMDMASNVYADELEALVNEGVVPMEQLDAAVRNVLRVKFELGLFDNPYQTNSKREKRTILCEQHRALAREAAQKSIVLLKNQGGILPLNRNMKIGLAGELAFNRGEMTGTWAVAADGNDCVSLADGMNNCGAEVIGMENGKWESAKACDVIVVALGEKKDDSGEAASKAVLDISKEDKQMIEALLWEGKPLVAVLFNGRPLALPWLESRADAIVEAWHPGVEAGNAIADILFGDVNPSAKLTATFPNTAGQCPIYYAHIPTGRPAGKSKFTSKYLDTPSESLFPFGFGLSYTTFAYSDLTAVQAEGGVRVSVTVTNTGERAGDEIVQCYFRDVVASRARPVKQLVDFAKVHLEAGESREVVFEVPFGKLGFYDMEMQYVVEPGEFRFFAGGNSRDTLEASYIL